MRVRIWVKIDGLEIIYGKVAVREIADVSRKGDATLIG